MNNAEKRLWLIKYLISEKPEYKNIEIPEDKEEQFNLYRSLVNVRLPESISDEYLKTEDEYLKEENERRGSVSTDSLTPVQNDIYLWQGDITRLECGAIVNAANSQLLGCFYPLHTCIDNCIHTFAGVRLRLKCNEIMTAQNSPEPTGRAKITPAYNLPCDFVIHTVGPIINGALRSRDRALLASCYLECLRLADENNIKSIAFCCISTGVFHFPNDEAAKIAVDTVKNYKNETNSKIKVIFNVFKDLDKELYSALLS